jgi:thiamine transporter ThiT
VGVGARYLCHLASGYILFAAWAESYFLQDGFPAWGASLVQSLSPEGLGIAYSAVYNGMYMLPEMLFTALGALLISRIPGIVKKVS